MRNKITLILFSITIGFFIGAGVVYLGTSPNIQSNKKSKPNVNQQKEFVKQAPEPEEIVAPNEKVIPKPQKQKVKVKKEISKGKSDLNLTDKVGLMDTVSFSSDTTQFDTLAQNTSDDSVFISKAQTQIIDSIKPFVDSLAQVNYKDTINNNLTIKKEELVARERVAIVSLGSKLETKAKNDSLLDQLADVKENKEMTVVSVEFWESPINYSGYKFGSGRLLLFGLDYYPKQLKMYKDQNGFFFTYLNETYHIVETFEFKPYQKVTTSKTDEVNE